MRIRIIFVAIAALIAAAHAADVPQGPSFSCAHVTSTVNKLICATPALQALDRELATVFDNMKGQPGIDQKVLRTNEDRWLAALRRECADVACIKAQYEERLAMLKFMSANQASPAAAGETRPFVAPASVWSDAQSRIGRPCARVFADGSPFDGYSTAKGAGPVTLNGAYVVVRERAGASLAFLLAVPGNDLSKCRVADAVALPAGATLLSCTVPDPQSATPLSAGVGVRAKGKMRAYWSVEAGKLEREPLSVLGWKDKLRCREPETAE